MKALPPTTFTTETATVAVQQFLLDDGTAVVATVRTLRTGDKNPAHAPRRLRLRLVGDATRDRRVHIPDFDGDLFSAVADFLS